MCKEKAKHVVTLPVALEPKTFVIATFNKNADTLTITDRTSGEVFLVCESKGYENAFSVREVMLGVVLSNTGKESEVMILETADMEEQHVVTVSNLNLPKGSFVDVTLSGELLTFSLKEETLAITSAAPAIGAFGRRKKLKAVVLKNVEEFAVVLVLRFVDPHRHSGYSFLDGSNSIDALVRKTEYAGALTDHRGMYGSLAYYNAMRKAGKLPIIGFEAYAENIQGSKQGNHLLLLAKNETGYKNLTKLTSLAFENFHKYPHVSYEMLSEYSEGVMSTTTCLGSEVNKLLADRKFEEARYVVKQMVKIFGKEDYYVEIQRHGAEEELIVNPQLQQIAKEFDLKLVASTDAHYENAEDRPSQEVLMCIGTKKLMSDESRIKFPGGGYHIHTADEIEELFSDIPEALDNTFEIMEKCADFKIQTGKNFLPAFEFPAPFKSEIEYLRHLTKVGYKERFDGKPEETNPVYTERLAYELDVLEGMGFPGYFLIVNDFIVWAKNKGILVGPGRGSAAGSLVAYCLHITDLDPIPYGLLFERFLNPDRISMPDIDIDFPDGRREEVLAYVRNKYGEHAVSKIITFQTLAARSSVKDVARVLEFPLDVVNKAVKLIPVRPDITLKEALEESPEFRDVVNGNPALKNVVETAQRIEGLPRNPSVHACGLIIAPGEVSDYAPTSLMMNKKIKMKEATCQYTMGEVEEIGLLKMDFLGLRTMTVIASATELVNEKRALEGLPPMHYLDIPLGDPKVYQNISQGDAYGVFQLESPGMRAFMKELFADASDFKENDIELFERLVAGVSLYRPGPMDYIPEYLDSMRNPLKVRYDHPLLEGPLKGTYGVIVFQEQTMQIVRSLAGFTKGEADNVRKAFAKKKKEMIEPLGKKFVAGCIANNISTEIAEKIWSKMVKFGSYAFNKSHAAVYSMLSNATAWFKTYHPEEFMAATLNSFLGKYNKLKLYLSIISRMNIEILPPDINRSEAIFTVEDKKIRFGLMGLKGLGQSAGQILEERKERGEFCDMQDVIERMVVNQKMGKSTMKSLIQAGALDSMEGTRRAKIDILEAMFKHADKMKKISLNKEQMSMFDLMNQDEVNQMRHIIPVPNLPEMMKNIMITLEKEVAGFYITAHPLDDYIDVLNKEGVYDIGFLFDESEDEDGYATGGTSDYEGQVVKIAGVVESVETFYAKKSGKPIKKILIEDRSGEFSCVAFEETIKQNADMFVEGRVLMVQGVVKVDDFGASLTIRSMVDISEMDRGTKSVGVELVTEDKGQARNFLEYVKANPGDIDTFVVMGGQTYRLPASLDAGMQKGLFDIYGERIRLRHA
ncbi:DNA polymerase III subunit alpha [Psychrobacillus sp. FSL K6-1464]|uniref:DNA polymerase III subunit alpha n=1 Tax=Psychrobacillus sp. FSL K6-1464 TaxID=2921545 RepID=UPI0030F4EBF2